MGMTGCPKMSVWNYHSAMRNIAEGPTSYNLLNGCCHSRTYVTLFTSLSLYGQPLEGEHSMGGKNNNNLLIYVFT